MKTLVYLTALMTISLASSAQAQTDTVGWGPNSGYSRMYNPNTVVTIEGKITKVQYVSPMGGMSSSGVHLSIDSKGFNYSVHVGPKWYLDKQSVKLNENDNVTIKGSKVTMGGEDEIIAQQITNGKETLELRNEAGIPKWSMGKRGKKSR